MVNQTLTLVSRPIGSFTGCPNYAAVARPLLSRELSYFTFELSVSMSTIIPTDASRLTTKKLRVNDFVTAIKEAPKITRSCV